MKMRKDIGVETVKGRSFTVSYISDDARAMGVTQRPQRVHRGEPGDRGCWPRGRTSFSISARGMRASARRARKARTVRERFEGELPTQLQSNLQVEHNAETQLQSIIESINRDRDRRLLQERLLADARQPLDIEAATPTAAATGKPSLPSGMSAAEQLEDARNTPRDLQLRLTPSHPDIVRSERAVRELEAKVAAEALKRPVSKDVPAVPLTAVQVAQRNRLRELQLEVQNLDEQIARKQAEQQRVEGVIATYQRRIAAVPTHESELTELMRDYDTLQKTT